MYHELPVGNLADETPVLVRYPRTTEEERGDRAKWPWLPGTILQQVGPDEWRGPHAPDARRPGRVVQQPLR
jgi:hypothetical protein